MHFKFVLFLLGVGYCVATWAGTKNIQVSEDGSVIEVTTPEGKKISIVKSRPTLDKGKSIDISVIRPDMPPRTIRIHDDSETYGNSYDELYGSRIKRGSKSNDKSQSDIITELFSEYRGVNDEKTYEKFMKKVEKYVQKGEIDPQILTVLRELDSGSSSDLLQHGGLGLGLQGREDITQGLLDRIMYGQQSMSRLPADELLREKIIEAEISSLYKEEQQAKFKRLLLEEQVRETLNKNDQLSRVPLTRTPYDRWSLLGSRDYQGVGVDPANRWQFLQQIQAGDQRGLLGPREDQSSWMYGQKPFDWAISKRNVIDPDQVRLNELMREQQLERLVSQPAYDWRSPLASSGLYNWNVKAPMMWQLRRNTPMLGEDYSQRLWQTYPFSPLNRPVANWQYPMSVRSYNYQRQVPVVPTQVW